jgi:prepilin-type N-terminal cleavage/methylation domain-containing protein
VSNDKKQNKGFTLIELIIAIAMLAFLMTAVSSFMTAGIASYKKAKADVRVHNSAQDNYDKISDAIMEAKNIYIYGYKVKSDGNIDTQLTCFVRDKNVTLPDLDDQFGIDGVTPSNTEYFEDLKSSEDIYIRALVIDRAVEIDDSSLINDSLKNDTSGASYVYTNQLTGEDVTISQAKRGKVDADGNPVYTLIPVLNADGTVKTDDDGNTIYEQDTELVADVDGGKVYSEKDVERQLYLFDDCDMYYMTKYAFAKYNNDNYATDTSGGSFNVLDTASSESQTSAKLSSYIYSSSFETTETAYISTLDKRITNCIAHIDASDSAVSVDLHYSDKNMTYTTSGMIKTRNSNVIKPKKVSTDSTSGTGSTEESDDEEDNG